MYNKCDSCVFTEINNNLQIGCLVGRLEKFKLLDGTKRNDNGFYDLGRKCNMYRSKLDNPNIENINNYIKIVRYEIESNFTLSVIVKTLDGLEECLESINNQILKPKRVIIFRMSSVDLMSVLTLCRNKLYGLNWQIEDVIDDLDKVIDISLRKNQKGAFFYAFITDNFILSPDYFRNIDIDRNDELKMINVYLPDFDCKVFVIQAFMFWYIGVPYSKMIDKLLELRNAEQETV